MRVTDGTMYVTGLCTTHVTSAHLFPETKQSWVSFTGGLNMLVALVGILDVL